MIQAYSINVDSQAGAAVPFNNIVVDKGAAECIPTPSTITLNRCGVYKVEVTGNAATAGTIQLYVDGVAQPQAISTGTTVELNTLIQSNRNNNNCCCSKPVTVQVITPAELTLTMINIIVTKLC